MVDDSTIKVSPKIFKYVYLIVLLIGITLLVSWYVLFDIPMHDYLEIGIFSFSICVIGFGVVGVWLYSNLEKKAIEDKKKAKDKKK